MQEFFEEYLLSIAELGMLVVVAKILMSVVETVWRLPL